MTCMSRLLVQIRVREQSEVARALHRSRQLALVVRSRACDPRGDDLAVFADEILEQIDVLVVDPFDFLSGEAAEFPALEELLRALLLALAVTALALAFESASTSRWGHVSLLPQTGLPSRATRLSGSCGSLSREIRLPSHRFPASPRRGASLPARTPPLQSRSSPCARLRLPSASNRAGAGISAPACLPECAVAHPAR